MRKALVAVSGGVDSAVAALLLQKAGYRVCAVYMRTWPGGAEGTPSGGCYGPDEDDLSAAQAVASHLGVPLLVIDLRREFSSQVLDYFVSEYTKGRTPNPCVVCNRFLKFELLPAAVRATGETFDLFATGHYARIVRENGRVLLAMAADRAKDQSYFLAFLRQEHLAGTVLPVGELRKAQVREIARKAGLPVHERKESQDFISGSRESFFPRAQPGPICDTGGKRLGTHRGIVFYTVGQRTGLGISSATPLYVVSIESATNTLIVGPAEACYRKTAVVAPFQTSSGEPLSCARRFRVKIRSSHTPAQATVTPLANDAVRIEFDRPQWAVTPGQAAVAYEKTTVAGAGFLSAQEG